ncbi:hypothetical protein GCM10011584_25630 [Nocardioides phosphati]|uniref:Uncharacterized protein n=1 Tax=Nocardioides phosphati TaxID=1867775 RepID=A0ABQ2NBC2_9ACTN|nr:hypothetical protein [Nocardioides phosphati]GGO91466.1 hypothetical protein GCM10011584_25630 [Nocardioides phosphati]
MSERRPGPRIFLATAVLVLAATIAQLAVATFVPGIERFEGKAFGARLAAYPVMMLAVPALWWLHQRRSGLYSPVPWAAFTLVMVPCWSTSPATRSTSTTPSCGGTTSTTS